MKRTFKSFIAAVMAACVCFTFSACGNSATSEKDIEKKLEQLDKMSAEDAEKEIEKGLSTIDEQDKTNEETLPKGGTAQSGRIVASDEILSAEMYSGLVQLGNTVFDLNASTAQDFIDAGAIFKKYDPETFILDANSHTSFNEVSVDGIKYTINFYNGDDERKILKDCSINQPWLKASSKSSFICPKGITLGSTVDELIAAYGEPTYVDIDTYYYVQNCVSSKYGSGYMMESIYEKDGVKWYSVGGKSYIFYIDLSTNTIKNMTVYDKNNQLINNRNKDCKFGEVYPVSAKINNEKITAEVYMDIPEYYDNNMCCTYSNGDKILLIKNKATPLKAEVGFTGLTEYTDSSLTEFCELICASGNKEYVYNYDYKINDSEAIAVISKNKGSEAKIYVYFLNEDFYSLKSEDILVFACNGYEEVTEDDIKAGYDLFYEIGENIKLTIK